MAHPLSRRRLLAAAPAALLLTRIPACAADVNQFKLGIITDEVSQDFEQALVWAKGFGLHWVELRFLWNKYVVDLPPDDVKRAKDLLDKYQMKVSVVDSPYFKTLLPRTQFWSERWRGRKTSAPTKFVSLRFCASPTRDRFLSVSPRNWIAAPLSPRVREFACYWKTNLLVTSRPAAKAQRCCNWLSLRWWA